MDDCNFIHYNFEELVLLFRVFGRIQIKRTEQGSQNKGISSPFSACTVHKHFFLSFEISRNMIKITNTNDLIVIIILSSVSRFIN
jgi:hypothetical protein